MQTVETTSISTKPPFLMDDIYTPSLDTPHLNVAHALNMQVQQQQKAILELHRFLESSCDCV